jgi:hypothetical protein
MSLRQSCTSYAPQHDPVKCKVCLQRLSDHDKSVREAFFRSAPDKLMEAINHRAGYLKLTEPAKCVLYRPTDYGSDVILCDCGRLRTEHNLRVIVKGSGIQRKQEEPFLTIGLYTKSKDQCGSFRHIAEGKSGYCNKRAGHVERGDKIHVHKSPELDAQWTDDLINGRKSDSACAFFDPIVDYPGQCRWCNHRYIDHALESRGRHLEELSHMHSPGCNCIQKLGDHSCTCLGDLVKQQMLESMGDVRRRTGGKTETCKRFTPAQGEAQSSLHCVSCNKSFFQHLNTATDGFALWSQWRATRMTDAEVIRWFLKSGATMEERVNNLQRVIDKFDRGSPFTPSLSMCKALMDMLPLDLKRLVKVKDGSKTIHKPGCLGSSSCNCVASEARCDSCNEPLITDEIGTCADCLDYMVKSGWGRPVLTPPKVEGAATEPNINSDGEWEGGFVD